ncbi:hypothetical protein PsorP6_009955 [Peronosclerospora sorghi]|uniref:Uncharacterized protein n=1 Tax=Peronosclerospora sorghi TaxID=230839 RepID=A0ACC0VX98_9STRA|nr:hypothetical protein PsorP6_009955 [Peronosclerospora sorghi]
MEASKESALGAAVRDLARFSETQIIPLVSSGNNLGLEESRQVPNGGLKVSRTLLWTLLVVVALTSYTKSTSALACQNVDEQSASDVAVNDLVEVERSLRSHDDKLSFDYYAAGADNMVTLKENRETFKHLHLVWYPRVLRDVPHVNISTTLLSHRISLPVCVAPSAMHLPLLRRADTCYILSTIATTSLEDVANAKSKANLYALRWYQLYIFKDRELTCGLVLRAEKAGYKAIVLTVDMPILGDREPDVRNRLSLPNHLTMANFTQMGGVHEHGVHTLRDSGLAGNEARRFHRVYCQGRMLGRAVLDVSDRLE